MGFSVREYVKEKKHSGGSTSVYSSGRGVPANSSGNQSRKNSGEANNGSVYTVKTFLGTAANGGSTQKAKADTHSAAADTSGLLGFLEDYGSFAKESKNSYLSAANTYKSASDSGKQNAKKQKEVNEYRGKIEGYLADVKSLDKLYGEGASSVVSEHLNSMNAELDAISKAYDLQNSFWQQFESEADYKNYEERKKEAERLAALDVNKEKRKLTGLKAQLEEAKKAKNLAVLGYSARNSVFAADEKYKLQNDSDLQRVNDAISAYKELQNKISAVEADIYNAEKVQKDNLYNSYLGADDFDFYSKLGASVKNPGTTEYLYDHEINNVLDYLQRMEENPHYSANPVGNKYHIYSYLDEDEESIYNYMLGKYGKEEAQEYLDHMREALNYINGEEISERLLSMDDGWGKKLSLAVHSFSSGLENSVTGIGQLLSSERLPTSSLQFSQEKIREGLREEGKNAAVLALDAINSIGNMAPSLLLSVVAGPTAGPIAGSVTLGLSASGNAYNQALAEGKNKKDAATYGVLIGASEGVLQRVLGGIGRLGGTAAQKLGISLNNIDNALLRISSKFVLSSLSEGGEEYLQAVLEPMYRNIIFGENNEVKLVSEEAAYSALLGMITSGILEGAPTAVKDANKAYLADVITEAGNYDLLLKNALALEDGSKAKSLAAKLTLGSLKKNNANIGELVAAYSAEGGDVSVLTRRALSEHSQASEGKADVSADGVSAAKTEKTATAPLREKTGKAVEQMLTEAESEKASSENTGALGKYQKYISNAANAVKNTVGDRINSMIAAIKPSVDMEITISGETYDNYKSLSEHETEIKKEIETLENLPDNQISVKQREQLKALRDELKALEDDSTVAQYKDRLSQEVSELAKNDRLVENYNERARGKELFAFDASKYKGLEKESLQGLADSKLLNNKRSTHEFWEYATKAAAKRGRKVKAMTTEEILVYVEKKYGKEYVEKNFGNGEIPNGLILDDGSIGINVKSQAARSFVFGHEIGHTMEEAKMFDEISELLFNYAEKVEGDTFKQMRTEIEELYKNVEGSNAKVEITNNLIGKYIYNDSGFLSELVKHKNAFNKMWDGVKHLYKMATAGSQEARALERIKRKFEQVYRETQDAEISGKTELSLSVKEVNGTEHIVNPLNTTRDEILDYMDKSRRRVLEDKTYFPVSSHTPQTLIATLRNAGIEITDKPMAMQAQKARRSQIDAPSYKKDGSTIRFHAMEAEEVLETIDKLNDAKTIIQQTERTKKIVRDGEKVVVSAPDNFAMFVELDSGKEVVAIIEFDSVIDENYIVHDGKGEEFHTTVTVFEPDVIRDGMPYDYAEYLLSSDANRELEIKKESSVTEADSGENLATASETKLSDGIVSQFGEKVKTQFSLSEYAAEEKEARNDLELELFAGMLN